MGFGDHNMLKHFKLIASCSAVMLMLAANSYSGDYYRWVIDGITHYGAAPPAGVEAELVTTYNDNGGSDADSPANDIDAKAKDLREQRAQQCADEESRVATLKSSGARIRMTDEKGESRYLTVDEIQSEIALSEKFLNEACSK